MSLLGDAVEIFEINQTTVDKLLIHVYWHPVGVNGSGLGGVNDSDMGSTFELAWTSL
jgi:hypothetical protein